MSLFSRILIPVITFAVGISLFIGPNSSHSQNDPKQKQAAVQIKRDVPQYLQDISVTLKAGQAQGSGTFKVTKDGQVWIWTCGHLVEKNRVVTVDDKGKETVSFKDLTVMRRVMKNGREVGSMTMDAEVIRYSDASYGQDLALLKLRDDAFKPAQSVVFYMEDKVPAIGTRIMHCGSFLGYNGSNSVSAGIISQHGRILLPFNKDVHFDQSSAPAYPGSSGGIVCLEDGRYIGMLVRGVDSTFTFYAPVNRMRIWAKMADIEFAMDDSAAIPTYEELMRRPIDTTPTRNNLNGVIEIIRDILK